MSDTPRGADGEWEGGWSATKVDPATREAWAYGWDRAQRCPADPKAKVSPGDRELTKGDSAAAGLTGGETWREAGLAGGEDWREAHETNRRLRRLLRRAGYVQRHRWHRHQVGRRTVGKHQVDDWRYIDGPAAGLQAVDAWKVCENLGRCAFSWYVQLRLTTVENGGLLCLGVPKLCNRKHECAVCSHARSGYLAAALREVLGELHRKAPAPLVLATFTHKAHPDEILSDTLARLRGAMARMMTGRPGTRFRQMVEGWYRGDEVTRGRDGNGVELGHWWHVHRHMVLRLAPGMDEAIVRDELAQMWAAATEAEAEARGIPGYGWNPVAGGVVTLRDGTRPYGFAGGWWKPIDPDDPKKVYQACKYPTPLVTLHPVALAEWLAVAHGRRWHEGGGSLRGILRQAEELEQAGGGWIEEGGGDEEPVDLGELVHRCGPTDAPNLDTVAPEHGWPGVPEGPPPVGMRRWVLSDGAPREELEAAAALVGGELRDGAIYLPAAWVADQVRRTSAALAAVRRKRPRPE